MITSSAGDYNLTSIDLQEVWEKAVCEAVALCGALGKLYQIPGAHDVPEDAVAIDWGNGVPYDEDKTWEDYKSMDAVGLIKPEIALGWRFNMPTTRQRIWPRSDRRFTVSALRSRSVFVTNV